MKFKASLGAILIFASATLCAQVKTTAPPKPTLAPTAQLAPLPQIRMSATEETAFQSLHEKAVELTEQIRAVAEDVKKNHPGYVLDTQRFVVVPATSIAPPTPNPKN